MSKPSESEIFLTQKTSEGRIGSLKKKQHTETHTHKSVANLNLLAFSDLTHAMERRNYSPERSLMLSSRYGIGIKLDAPPNPAKPCLVEHLNLERGLGLLYP